jgi:hypothetical protein
MSIVSRIFAALVLGCAALLGANAATASGLQASKAVYATENGNPLLQHISRKPCCYSYNSGTFGRYSAKTCYRINGRLVDDRYCQGNGYGYGHDQNWRDDRWRDQRWQDPRWHQPQGQLLCCKRGRKEWWVQSVWECSNRRNGAIVHPNYCVRH